MRSQAREAGFFIRLQATKNFPPSRYRESGRGVGVQGWALPVAFVQLRQYVWDYVGLFT